MIPPNLQMDLLRKRRTEADLMVAFYDEVVYQNAMIRLLLDKLTWMADEQHPLPPSSRLAVFFEGLQLIKLQNQVSLGLFLGQCLMWVIDKPYIIPLQLNCLNNFVILHEMVSSECQVMPQPQLSKLVFSLYKSFQLNSCNKMKKLRHNITFRSVATSGTHWF